MKDLITDIIAANGFNQQQGATGGTAGSLFNSTMPTVLDVRHRLMKWVFTLLLLFFLFETDLYFNITRFC